MTGKDHRHGEWTGAGSRPVALENRDGEGDGRLYSPSAARNREPVCESLRPLFQHNSIVFEVGSGSGEHGAYICDQISHIHWYPSDPDERSRRSIAAWSSHSKYKNFHLPLDVSTTEPDWARKAAQALAVQPTLLVSLNMIHISPWASCVGLFRGAYDLLSDSGQIYLYGPFLEGEDTAPSNLDFDRDLKARNAEWGVRPLSDVVACAAQYGFQMVTKNKMPANNLSVIFHKAHLAGTPQ